MLSLEYIHQGMPVLGHTFCILGWSRSCGHHSSCGSHGPEASCHPLHNLHCFNSEGAGTDQAIACENDLPRRGAGIYGQVTVSLFNGRQNRTKYSIYRLKGGQFR